ncbi:MAG: hypothetical protein JKY37_12475 [Nannocystaceae bacterium]|nr:hypothetical protein [Nannocystaceae bacterium]
MKRNKDRATQAFVAVFMLAIVGCGPKLAGTTVTPTTGPQSPQPRKVTTTAAGIASSWLWLDCSQGDNPQLQKQVAKAATVLESLFMAAYRDGPPKAEVARIEGALRDRFAARKATLVTGVGLSKRDRNWRSASTKKCLLRAGFPMPRRVIAAKLCLASASWRRRGHWQPWPQLLRIRPRSFAGPRPGR